MRNFLKFFFSTKWNVDISKEHADAVMKAQFDFAKLLSDFIGMIVRVAFAFYATVYFASSYAERGGFMKFAVGVSAVAAGLMALFFGCMITALVSTNLVRWSALVPIRWLRVPALIVLAIIYCGICGGLVDLVFKLPRPAAR
jgi:hypothetical protein